VRYGLLTLGALVAIVLTVLGVTRTVDAVRSFSEVRVGDTRTPIPGASEVELDDGKYVLFYEISDAGAPASGDGSLFVPPLDVRVSPAGAARSLDLDDYSTDFDVSTGGRYAQAMATVDVPEEGPYTLAVSGSADDPSPAVVLGRPIIPRILRLIAGIAGAVAGLALLALVCALAIAFAVQGRKAAG